MKIIIIGCGKVGSRLARDLSSRGHVITVIDHDPLAFERLGTGFKGTTMVGIGFDRDVLIKAGIERADAVATVTESDEANVVAAKIAKQVFRVPRVAARVYEPRKADIYRRLGIQTISPTVLGASRLAALLLFSHLTVVDTLGAGEVDMIEAELPPHLNGRKVGDLQVTGEILVVSITRVGKTFIPNASTVFEASDMLYLAVRSEYADRLRDILGHA